MELSPSGRLPVIEPAAHQQHWPSDLIWASAAEGSKLCGWRVRCPKLVSVNACPWLLPSSLFVMSYWFQFSCRINTLLYLLFIVRHPSASRDWTYGILFFATYSGSLFVLVSYWSAKYGSNCFDLLKYLLTPSILVRLTISTYHLRIVKSTPSKKPINFRQLISRQFLVDCRRVPHYFSLIIQWVFR